MRFQTYESPVTLLDLLASIIRYKWRALLVTGLMFVFVGTGILLFPKRYQSEAKLFVRLGRGSASMDPATIGQTISIQESRETEMNSIIDMLQSRALAEKIVADVGADRLLKKYAWVEVQLETVGDWVSNRLEPVLAKADGDPTGTANDQAETQSMDVDAQKKFELATKEIESNLRVSSPKRSTTIAVAYRAREPELAKVVVESVIKNYRDMHIAAYQSRGALEFFDKQFSQQEQIVSAAEGELRETKNANKVITVRGKQEQLQAEITDLKKLQLETAADLQATLARVEELKSSMAKLDGTIIAQQTSGIAAYATDSMRNRLYELEIEEKELASKYVSSDPRLLRVREQIRSAREIVDQQPQEKPQSVLAVNPVYQQIENELLVAQSSVAGLRAKADALESLESQMLSQLAAINDLELESEEMQRRIEIARENHRSYAVKLEESRINAALDEQSLSNVSVVGAPNVRYKHVSPKRSVLALVGGFFSILCGVLVAIVSDYGRNARELAVIRRAEREAYLRRLQSARDMLDQPVALENGPRPAAKQRLVAAAVDHSGPDHAGGFDEMNSEEHSDAVDEAASDLPGEHSDDDSPKKAR